MTKELITKHYIDHPFLNRSIYPKGWNVKMDKKIEQEKENDKAEKLKPLN